MKVLRVISNLGAGRVNCDGAEVTEGGGSDEERLDYARVEAADLLATDVESAGQLPARVALLPDKYPWFEGGGQPCASRVELIDALRTRMAALKPGWRIEGRGRERGIFSVREVDAPEGESPARAE